jgi:hypothetical protein
MILRWNEESFYAAFAAVGRFLFISIDVGRYKLDDEFFSNNCGLRAEMQDLLNAVVTVWEKMFFLSMGSSYSNAAVKIRSITLEKSNLVHNLVDRGKREFFGN